MVWCRRKVQGRFKEGSGAFAVRFKASRSSGWCGAGCGCKVQGRFRFRGGLVQARYGSRKVPQISCRPGGLVQARCKVQGRFRRFRVVCSGGFENLAYMGWGWTAKWLVTLLRVGEGGADVGAR